MSITAGSLIINVRDQIPDAVYVNGQAEADGNGKFRAQTLYRWLDEGARMMVQRTGWTIDDWWPFPQRPNQPSYVIDPRYHRLEAAFANQWPCNTLDLNEADAIWPNSMVTASQSLWAYVRRLSDHLEVGFWPVPALTEPTPTLSGNIGASGSDPILLSSVTNFLSYGYVTIDAEVIRYQKTQTSPAGIAVVTRGEAGTAPAAHASGATVQHCGLWIKGQRSPNQITGSATVVEIPMGWIMHLEGYVLARCRSVQGRGQEAQAAMQGFEQACANINADPRWKVNQGRLPIYGEGKLGPVYGRHGWGYILP